MVELLNTHDTTWLAPAPLWQAMRTAVPFGPTFARPAILRFNSDLFMDELLALLAYRPDRLEEWVACPETWRRPMATPPTAAKLNVVDPISSRSKEIAQQAGLTSSATTATVAQTGTETQDELPLKLYQPSQQRYYLITSSLVCRKRGLPDRTVNPGNQENTGFVIRRLTSDDMSRTTPCQTDGETCHEYAYVNTANGYVWKKLGLGERRTLQPEEERLPMFGIAYDQQPHTRRLLAGMIPVGKRETYLAAPEENGDTAGGNVSGSSSGAVDPRRLLFETQVTAPWKALVEQAQAVEIQMLESPDADPSGASEKNIAKQNLNEQLKNIREQIQTGSWYLLLDFALFLKEHLIPVWQELRGVTPDRALTSAEEKLAKVIRSVTIAPGSDLYDAIDDYAHASYSIKTSMVAALTGIVSRRDDLEDVVIPFDCQVSPYASDNQWPPFLFPVANPAVKINQSSAKAESEPNLAVPVPATDASVAGLSDIDKKLAHIDELANLVEAGLGKPDQPLVELEMPDTTWDNRKAWFVIRCVYERPNCGPLNPPVVSQATEPFQMAPFFDPDAPARPVRIPMPVDISPAGLRKFKKNATFMISDMLCGKISSIRKLTLGDLVLSVLPWPFHKRLPDVGDTGPCKKGSELNIGMFCSLSIPIVTLCALILLMIIVQLFDIFFRWIPNLFICFPIPGFKGKRES